MFTCLVHLLNPSDLFEMVRFLLQWNRTLGLSSSGTSLAASIGVYLCRPAPIHSIARKPWRQHRATNWRTWRSNRCRSIGSTGTDCRTSPPGGPWPRQCLQWWRSCTASSSVPWYARWSAWSAPGSDAGSCLDRRPLRKANRSVCPRRSSARGTNRRRGSCPVPCDTCSRRRPLDGRDGPRRSASSVPRHPRHQSTGPAAFQSGRYRGLLSGVFRVSSCSYGRCCDPSEPSCPPRDETLLHVTKM